MVRRGPLRIAANLGAETRRLHLGQPAVAVLAASGPGVAIGDESLTIPPAAFAVVETGLRGSSAGPP
jgi:uncharacterized protein DUF3459